MSQYDIDLINSLLLYTKGLMTSFYLSLGLDKPKFCVLSFLVSMILIIGHYQHSEPVFSSALRCLIELLF